LVTNSPHPDYAEIVVVRHGETAWNATAKIQVFSLSYQQGFMISLNIAF